MPVKLCFIDFYAALGGGFHWFIERQEKIQEGMRFSCGLLYLCSIKNYKMKTFFNVLYFCLVFVISSQAHEGMWLPILLNIDHMQQNGLKLSAEDIYSINKESLKD